MNLKTMDNDFNKTCFAAIVAILLGVLVFYLFAYPIASSAQKEVNDRNDIKNAANYIEVFEYSGHEYLRYKTGNGKIGGLCHKQNCKYCK